MRVLAFLTSAVAVLAIVGLVVVSADDYRLHQHAQSLTGQITERGTTIDSLRSQISGQGATSEALRAEVATLHAQVQKLTLVDPATCVLWTADGRYNVSIYEVQGDTGSSCKAARKANWRDTGPAVGGIVCDLLDRGEHFVFRTTAAQSYLPCGIALGFFSALRDAA